MEANPVAIRVLVVDDSAFMRQIITKMLQADPRVQVIGTAMDGQDGLDKVKALNPDVVTLDLEMPRMNGLECLKFIMAEHPCPVVIVSSLAKEGAEQTLQALELGAVDFVTKPSSRPSDVLWDMETQLLNKVIAASKAVVRGKTGQPVSPVKVGGFTRRRGKNLPLILGIGASTGGPRAIQSVLAALPADFPVGVVIAQHMPKGFTNVFAQRLNANCLINVKEAQDGDLVKPGLALVAPSGYQTEVVVKGTEFMVAISEQEQIYRPSVDILFNSLAKSTGRQTVAVLLTGMGADGAKGLKALRDLGARTISEAEESCVVYGMPRVAKELGAAEFTLALPHIPGKIMELIQESVLA
ncbi:MAG TPA: chemotaxis response regulator protein-glutamate methylesterase [Firmicutes bacterium]|jgi:two-component system chemotaxis response regulator CheB|nr:chemotaxis response regulator protein-glutamate methylesterase [Bacillota bacterium]